MSAIRCHFDGRVIVPDQPVDLPIDQPILIRVEPGVVFSQEASDAGPMTGEKLAKSDVVGIWADRKEIGESVDFARLLRVNAESRGGQR